MPSHYESVAYVRIIWATKPTRLDKIGRDGLYIKKNEVITDPGIIKQMEKIYVKRT
jgi:hypothetical protein